VLLAAVHESAFGPQEKPRSPPGTAAYWGTAAIAIFAWYAAWHQYDPVGVTKPFPQSKKAGSKISAYLAGGK
jgi:hypothetical protein